MIDIDKKIEELTERVNYAKDIMGDKEDARLAAFASKLNDVSADPNGPDTPTKVSALEQSLPALEEYLDRQLTAMDKVRIVRHPSRVCLKDILENVYDNYIEIGGRGEVNIDPGMLIARAYITRRVGKKTLNQPVMVVGQEKGHGEEFRNGGSIKPWGNAKALKYMKVAEQEGIPIHTYVFTPGSYPIEDPPGAAQQIAANIYEMAGITVPVVAVFSEGGSGGAEAVGMADKRLMLSHGYYSVISPEGAAAIEGRIRGDQRAPVELIEKCAQSQRITAEDNLSNGYIDGIIHEPPLGARPEHFDFFKNLRSEVIRATDEVVLNVGGVRLFRKLALRGKTKKLEDVESIIVRWKLNSSARERLVWKRYKKYRRMARHAFSDNRTILERLEAARSSVVSATHSFIMYDVVGPMKKRVSRMSEEAQDEIHVITGKVSKISENVRKKLGLNVAETSAAEEQLTCLSEPAAENGHSEANGVAYISPQARQDREVSCPHSARRGCLDIWAKDLFREFGGVCPNCGHHFRMEYQWYLHNVFDSGSIREFNHSIASGNPCEFPNFEDRVEKAKEKTGHESGCMTFTAKLNGIRMACAMLMQDFRGGSVGAAEGEKFLRALELARSRHLPFLAYVHGTAGIRIQEGVNGLIQMPRLTMAVRRYIQAGGLYIVLYDTNSYAGPVASFLGCSPYQFSVRSARVGFAGPGVIKETTGIEVPPNYHSAHKALSRSHIQDIWDRREVRKNLYQAFLTMGGRNLYYK